MAVNRPTRRNFVNIAGGAGLTAGTVVWGGRSAAARAEGTVGIHDRLEPYRRWVDAGQAGTVW